MRPASNSISDAKQAFREIQTEVKDAKRIVVVGGGTSGIEFAGVRALLLSLWLRAWTDLPISHILRRFLPTTKTRRSPLYTRTSVSSRPATLRAFPSGCSTDSRSSASRSSSRSASLGRSSRPAKALSPSRTEVLSTVIWLCCAGGDLLSRDNAEALRLIQPISSLTPRGSQSTTASSRPSTPLRSPRTAASLLTATSG